MRRADPRTIDQPGADQPLLEILRYRPVFWAVLSVTASYVIAGLFFARAQTTLTGFGWSAGTASWIVVAVAATRALTLRRTTREADNDLSEREQHHGRVLINSSALMGLSAGALGATLLPVGAITATVALVAAGVLCQYAMNQSDRPRIHRSTISGRVQSAEPGRHAGGVRRRCAARVHVLALARRDLGRDGRSDDRDRCGNPRAPLRDRRVAAAGPEDDGVRVRRCVDRP